MRTIRLAVSAVVVAVINTAAPGQNHAIGAEHGYPAKPIRLVHPFPPGGGTDAIGRILQPKLTEALGQSLVNDYRAGASGNIAAELVARAAPDGYTLLMGFSAVLTTNKSLYSKTGFDPIKDFAPITQLATVQFILLVHPSVPVRTVRDLVALAKAKPGSLTYASAGIAAANQLAMELFKRRAGVDIMHVAYKGGGPAATATMAGETQVMFASAGSSLPFVKTGRLRALAVGGLKRLSVAPELPTLDESGFPGFNMTAWHSFVAPAGTPRNIIDRIYDETVKVLRLSDVQQLIHNIGYEPTSTTPEQLAEIIRSESALWAKVIKEANIRAD